jgi:hypothetical protein
VIVPPPEQPALREAVKINSSIQPGEIGVHDYTPANTFQGKFRYSCPVCLRYFSHMLISACCSNYLCYFCANDLQNSPVHFEVRCPHCNESPVVLNDVVPDEPIKFYSDSPQATFQRNTGKFNEMRLLEIVVESQQGDHAESDEERAKEDSELYCQFASTV